VFFEDADRAMYLDLLARYAGRHGVRITGYCLMSNHVHLVAIPKAENALAKAIGRAHNDYARWLNVKRGESGHVWQSRFYSCPLDEQHQWEALRYVELNAVRAGLVGDAPDWPWSTIELGSWTAPNGAGDGPQKHGATCWAGASRTPRSRNEFVSRPKRGVRRRATIS
jgi:REP element-mobilizing transposase RayT